RAMAQADQFASPPAVGPQLATASSAAGTGTSPTSGHGPRCQWESRLAPSDDDRIRALRADWEQCSTGAAPASRPRQRDASTIESGRLPVGAAPPAVPERTACPSSRLKGYARRTAPRWPWLASDSP